MRRSVRCALVEGAQVAAWRRQMDAERPLRGQPAPARVRDERGREGGTPGDHHPVSVSNVAKNEDAAIASIEKELDVLQRLRRTG